MKVSSFVFVFFIAAASSLLTGCGAIYSPTLNLPHEPLGKEQGQLTTALSALPQIGSPDLGFAYSGEGQIAYGFSDKLSLQLKAWGQMSELANANFNGGSSISAIYVLNSRMDDIPVAIIPSSVMLVDGSTVRALGGLLQVAAWLPAIGKFRPYVAAGGGVLSNNFKNGDWGYGTVANVGVSAALTDHLRLNGELFAGVQRYVKNTNFNGYLAPSLSLSWSFDND